jgi:hypothetical protein
MAGSPGDELASPTTGNIPRDTTLRVGYFALDFERISTSPAAGLEGKNTSFAGSVIGDLLKAQDTIMSLFF